MWSTQTAHTSKCRLWHLIIYKPIDLCIELFLTICLYFLFSSHFDNCPQRTVFVDDYEEALIYSPFVCLFVCSFLCLKPSHIFWTRLQKFMKLYQCYFYVNGSLFTKFQKNSLTFTTLCLLLSPTNSFRRWTMT